MATTIPEMGATDMRSKIPLARNPVYKQGTFFPKTGATIHYNGPAIAGVEKWTAERLLRFIVDVDVPNHIARIPGDGLQYHYIVTPWGELWQARDVDRVLYHCANMGGNTRSLAFHLPLGTSPGLIQEPTELQLMRLSQALDVAGRVLGFPRTSVYGHQEWAGAATACPGEPLMHWLKEWRLRKPMAKAGMLVAHQPRITRERFKEVLFYGTGSIKDMTRTSPVSPAYKESDDMYDRLASRGIDPAVFLAFFAYESQLGTQGVNASYDLKNPGNTRTPMRIELIRGRINTEKGPFVQYISWAAGAEDWAYRMKEKYAKMTPPALTVEEILPIYAPVDDPVGGNVPQAYINYVLRMVESWSRAESRMMYEVLVDAVNVREGPGTTFPVALNGSMVVKKGHIFEADKLVNGQPVEGNPVWAHRADGIGFLWTGNLRALG